jgi:hypothetical protein
MLQANARMKVDHADPAYENTDFNLKITGMKTRFFLIACLAVMLNAPAFSQKTPEQVTKAEYVIALITDNEIVSVRISAENCHRAYAVDWLERVSIKNGFLVFSKGKISHAWDIEDAVAIEKVDDMIIIRLPDRIGLDWF